MLAVRQQILQAQLQLAVSTPTPDVHLLGVALRIDLEATQPPIPVAIGTEGNSTYQEAMLVLFRWSFEAISLDGPAVEKTAVRGMIYSSVVLLEALVESLGEIAVEVSSVSSHLS